jgi:hypothetical protein
LVTVAKITAPSIHDPGCQQQLADAMKDVSITLKGIFPDNMDKTWLNKGKFSPKKLYENTLYLNIPLDAISGTEFKVTFIRLVWTNKIFDFFFENYL